MIKLKLQRVKTHDDGCRWVDMKYLYGLTQWAEKYDTVIKYYTSEEDESWVYVEFSTEKYATLFLLTYEHALEIEVPC